MDTLKRQRGHAFLPPKATMAKIPPLYATDGIDAEDKVIHAHFFSAGTDHYIAELGQRESDGHWIAYGYSVLAAQPDGQEWGYMDLTEMEATLGRSPQGLPLLTERDMHWRPQPFKGIREVAHAEAEDQAQAQEDEPPVPYPRDEQEHDRLQMAGPEIEPDEEPAMTTPPNPMDRSAAFTALLELDPDGFGKSDLDASGATITSFLGDFRASGRTDMYAYARDWLREPPLTADGGSVEEATAGDEALQSGSAGRSAGSSVGRGTRCRTGDQEATAGGGSMTALFPGHVVEACNPYAPGLFVVAGDEITARWDTLPLPDTPAHWDTLPLPDTPVPFWPTSRVYLEPDAADTTRLDPPPSMLARWEAENEPDPGPTDRQLQDWNEHDAHADGLELEA